MYDGVARFPRLYAAASLKLYVCRGVQPRDGSFPRLYARGLIEAVQDTMGFPLRLWGFPRLYAAASLKRDSVEGHDGAGCSFPRLYAAASLKHMAVGHIDRGRHAVFRGFMPRPH